MFASQDDEATAEYEGVGRVLWLYGTVQYFRYLMYIPEVGMEP